MNNGISNDRAEDGKLDFQDGTERASSVMIMRNVVDPDAYQDRTSNSYEVAPTNLAVFQ